MVNFYGQAYNSISSSPILIYQWDSSRTPRLYDRIKKLGYEPLHPNSQAEAARLLESEDVGIIVSDRQELLDMLKEKNRTIPFILVGGDGSEAYVINAIKGGAFDCIGSLCTDNELVMALSRALNFSRMARQNSLLQKHIADRYGFDSIIARSSGMDSALEAACKVAESPYTTVAIYGESGAGKEVLARAIHFSGGGGPTNFVPVNCAAIPETLLESELFGHVKGAFTGAERDRDGKFSLASGGSLLLDEIGDMPVQLQTKLLRVLEERVYEKIGSNKRFPADFRVIAATHRDLPRLVKDGKFREDLFHRLNVFPIHIPSLRERREDIPELAEYFLSVFRKHQGKTLPGISRKAMDVLMAYSWPGNVRELRNCLERAAILVRDELIRPEHLLIASGEHPAASGRIDLCFSFEEEEFSLDAIIKRSLEEALRLCGGNKSLAAERLRINRKMFNRKLSPGDQAGT